LGLCYLSDNDFYRADINLWVNSRRILSYIITLWQISLILLFVRITQHMYSIRIKYNIRGIDDMRKLVIMFTHTKGCKHIYHNKYNLLVDYDTIAFKYQISFNV
jgi:hypothetical protein